MRRSLAKRGLDGGVHSALAALLDAPSDPGNWRVSSRRPVAFVSTPRSQLAEMPLGELVDLEVDILRKIATVSDTVRSLDVDPNTMQQAYEAHLRRMQQRAAGGGADGAAAGVDVFSHLRLQPPPSDRGNINSSGNNSGNSGNSGNNSTARRQQLWYVYYT
jgi:hypothetical protein